MKRKIIPVCLLFLLTTLACSMPALSGETFGLGPTHTPSPEPTSTPQPTPTPTPTPLPTVRIGLAQDALFAGDYDRALAELQSAFEGAADDDTRASARLGIGRLRLLQRNYEEAAKMLKEVTETFPESNQAAFAWFHLGQAYAELQLWQQAADAYGEYLHRRPGFIDAYTQEARGDALSAANNSADALVAYQAAAQAPQLSDPIYLEIKAARAYAALGDDTNALRAFMEIYDKTGNDYIKAQMDLLAGQVYIRMGMPEQAHARFQDSVANFPKAYDSYSALVALVDGGIPVDEYNRGLVDYFAGQFGVAVEAFNRYLAGNPQHDGAAHHYKALSMREIGDYAGAIAEWNALIADHAGDRFFTAAWDEKAYTQWVYLEEYPQAAQTLLDFIRLYPTADAAPGFLFEAARIFERANRLTEAANTWERLINEYPTNEKSYRALFLAAITRYRLGSYDVALTSFQRVLVLNSGPADQAMALLWVGKTYQALGQTDKSHEAWEQAAQADPTGYYSERARELLVGQPPLTLTNPFSLDVNLEQEQHLAELWVRTNFTVPEGTDLSNLGSLAQDERIRRGDEFWTLGLYPEASAEFEAIRSDLQNDAVSLFRLLNHLVDLGFYRSAVFTSRQILNLAGLDDAATFTAPNYFNHIRFGAYFRSFVEEAAAAEGFHPLFLLAVIRQESLFEGFVRSSAGARGLMQILPTTGQDVAETMHWPPDFTPEDLYRPMVSIRLGARYLARQRDYFGGDLYTMLAAYNGGPGNAEYWRQLAPGDPDLFLEVIRYDETRTYITQIAEFLNLYRRMYEIAPG